MNIGIDFLSTMQLLAQFASFISKEQNALISCCGAYKGDIIQVWSPFKLYLIHQPRTSRSTESNSSVQMFLISASSQYI